MNDIKNLRDQQINNYMSSFEDLREVDVEVIKEGLKQLLGEEPGVEFEYGVDFTMNETTGENERQNGLKKINVLYSYINSDTDLPTIGKKSYIVG